MGYARWRSPPCSTIFVGTATHRHKATLAQAESVPFRTLTPLGTTHTVENQSDLLRDVNLFQRNAALREAVEKWVPNADHKAHINLVGAYAGSSYTADLAELANFNKPQFCSHDRSGRRVDVVWH